MKIAFLNIYAGLVSRGAEVAVGEVAKRLSLNHQVTVFQSGRTMRSNYKIYSIGGIPLISTDVSNNLILRLLKKFYIDPYSLIVLYFSLRCVPNLIRSKHDVIISVNGFWQIILCKIIKLLTGCKLVVLGYAGIGIDDYVNLKLNPDAFFVMTKYAATWAKKVNPYIPIKVLPGGVDTQVFNPKAIPRKLPLKPPIILTVSALVPYKRVDLIIKAVSHLDNTSLVVAGNGILKKEIEDLGKRLLPDKFLRIDIDYKDLPSLYTGCNIFTLPSMHNKNSLFLKLTGSHPSEAFGIVYVEAMASGLPIVAPDDPLRREIIGNAGILVDCTNISEYATGLKKALSINWEERPKLQAKKFDWDKIVTKFSGDLQEVYDK